MLSDPSGHKHLAELNCQLPWLNFSNSPCGSHLHDILQNSLMADSQNIIVYAAICHKLMHIIINKKEYSKSCNGQIVDVLHIVTVGHNELLYIINES